MGDKNSGISGHTFNYFIGGRRLPLMIQPLHSKERDLKLREEFDELRLQKKRLDTEKKDHKKAREQEVKNIAASYQGKRTKRFSLHYPTNK